MRPIIAWRANLVRCMTAFAAAVAVLTGAPAHAQTPPAEPERQAGLIAYWSSDTSYASTLGQVDWARHSQVTIVPQINWPTTSLPFTEGGPTDYFAARFRGEIEVPESGHWTFTLGSDSGARLLINGVLVVNDDASHYYRERSGSIALEAGRHTLELQYIEHTGNQGLTLQWQGPGVAALTTVPASAFSHTPQEDEAQTGGLRAYWTAGASHATSLSQIDWTVYDSTTVVPNISWPTGAQAFYSGGPTDYFAARFAGTITLPEGGTWTFQLGSDAGARLYINDQLVINDDANHYFRFVSGTLTLPAGVHTIDVRYLEVTGNQGLVLTWRGPSDLYESVIPPSAFAPEIAEPSGDQSGPPGAGLNAYWHTGTSHATQIGHIAWGSHNAQSTVPKVYWPNAPSAFYPGGPADYFAGDFVGRIHIPEGGLWSFGLGSDAGARLFINGTLVINDDANHYFRFRNGVINLTPGDHDIQVQFLEVTGNQGLVLTWQGPNDPVGSVIPRSAFRPREITTPTGGGLTAFWYPGVSHATLIGHVDWAKHSATSQVDRINWPIRSAPFYESGPADYFAARFTGRINIPSTGSWTFGLGSDAGARLYIDGEPLVNDDANHYFRFRYGTRTLEAGPHDIEIRYLEVTGNQGLVLTWRGPGTAEEVVPSTALTPHDAEPPLDPMEGGLRAYWINGVSHATLLGHIDWNVWDSTTIEPKVSWKVSSQAFTTGGPTDYFAVRLQGRLLVPRAGNWTFSLGSDAGARLYINGQLVVNDDANHYFRFRTGTINLNAGPTDIEVRYMEVTGNQGLVLCWKGPGDPFEDVIPSAAFEPGAVSAPIGNESGDVIASWYATSGATSSLAAVNWNNPIATTQAGNIYWRNRSTPFYTGGRTDYFAARLTGTVRIHEPGPWTFNLGSDAGAELLINGVPVVTDDANHYFRFRSGTIELPAGRHSIEVRHIEVTGNQGLVLTWRAPSAAHEEVIPAAAFESTPARIIRWREVSAVDER